MLLAVGDRLHTRGRDAEADEKLLHGVGAARAKREVVFARAAFVAIAFDRNADRWIFLQPRRLALPKSPCRYLQYCIR
jgi:hypothetical protein